jgi:aminopeptidase N
MMEAYVGEDAWRRGVHDYLTAHAYHNATTEDLWSAVQAASGQPVLEIAHSFTRQVGLPMLNVTGCSNGTVSMTQRRFAADEAARTNERWSIPIVARQVGQAPVREVLPATEAGTVNIGGCNAYLVNAGHSAYARVHYDDADLAQLTSRFGALDAADQLGLLTDYWAFARSGDATFGNYLDLVAQMPANADPIIVGDTAGSFTAMAQYADGRPSQAAIRAYGISVLRPYFDRMGWTPHADELANDTQLRAELIGTLSELGDQQVIAEVRRRVQAADGGDASAIPASIRDAVMAAYAANATPEQYEALVQHARTATDFIEVRRSWLRVASVRDDALAQRTLDMVLTDAVPRQLRTQLIGRITANHPRLGWNFLKAHRAQVEDLLDPLSRGDFATNIAGANSDPAVADELEQYAANFPPGTRGTVEGAQSSIRSRAHTIATGVPQIEAWLAARNHPAPARRRH